LPLCVRPPYRVGACFDRQEIHLLQAKRPRETLIQLFVRKIYDLFEGY
jgi:hypothetical protein